jgi:sulfur-oxidizing protein SoxA
MIVRLAIAALVAGACSGSTCAAEVARDARRSGFEAMSPATQAMQRDDARNPGMLWVSDGEALWKRKEGKTARACADCHGSAPTTMRGVAARYPAFDHPSGKPINLAQRIAACRAKHQQAEPLRPESAELLSLESYVAHQSRGVPIAPPDDPRLAPSRERGRKLFEQRFGQLDLACAQCHEGNAGKRLAGSVIPQGHPTGYPVYRLEWQSLGSLQRRIRGCMSGVRAEPFPYGAPELVELELHLAWRAAGMPLESPGVRP